MSESIMHVTHASDTFMELWFELLDVAMRASLMQKMGRCKDLTTAEKPIIVTYLKYGMSTLQISKMLKRHHRTMKKNAADKIL